MINPGSRGYCQREVTPLISHTTLLIVISSVTRLNTALITPFTEEERGNINYKHIFIILLFQVYTNVTIISRVKLALRENRSTLFSRLVSRDYWRIIRQACF